MTAPAGLRSIALPTEHGGWGFTLEPIILGLLVAPSVAGGALGIAAVALFLARRPWRLLIEDRRRGRRLPRTRSAGRVVAVYLPIAAGGVTVALLTAAAPFWWPLLLAAPLAALQLWFDAHRRHRELLPEVAGAVAMAASAPAIAAAAGWEWTAAAGLWLVLAARAVPSIILVRALIRRIHGHRVRGFATYLAHLAAIAAAVGAAPLLDVPGSAIAAIAALLAVAAAFLRGPAVQARTIGWSQIVIGLAVVIAAGLGYRW